MCRDWHLHVWFGQIMVSFFLSSLPRTVDIQSFAFLRGGVPGARPGCDIQAIVMCTLSCRLPVDVLCTAMLVWGGDGVARPEQAIWGPWRAPSLASALGKHCLIRRACLLSGWDKSETGSAQSCRKLFCQNFPQELSRERETPSPSIASHRIPQARSAFANCHSQSIGRQWNST